MGTGGLAAGSEEVFNEFRKRLRSSGLKAEVKRSVSRRPAATVSVQRMFL